MDGITLTLMHTYHQVHFGPLDAPRLGDVTLYIFDGKPQVSFSIGGVNFYGLPEHLTQLADSLAPYRTPATPDWRSLGL